MKKTLSILMAQLNTTVGAIEKNTDRIIQLINANQKNHDLLVFPELAITGYPPEDLLFRPELTHRVEQALTKIKANTLQTHVIIGYPHYENGQCYNTASVINQGTEIARYYKQHLPNHGVFDERRYFTSDDKPCLFTIHNHRIGLCICEDLWQTGPMEQLIEAKVNVVVAINASPFDTKKYEQRVSLLKNHCLRGKFNLIYVNQVGGQDELLFDGQSMAFHPNGTVAARAPAFVACEQTVTLRDNVLSGEITPRLHQDEYIYKALCLGLHDYVEKNKFPGVLLGLSGGIDSALTLAIAVDALGAERVHAVMLPSRYTATMSHDDAMAQLNAMKVSHTTLSIEPAFTAILQTLEPAFRGLPVDTTEENIQARIRGLLLMALSNKTGNMVLTTSNKSETAVGYSTLYGDMAGGFSVLKDVLKTQVYALAHYRNTIAPVIPHRVLTRAPSAELAPNQTDQDNLPDYAILDQIIMLYMEANLSDDAIIQHGFNAHDVHRVTQLIKRNEYKRYQAAPGIKISQRAFGRDWRYPISAGF